MTRTASILLFFSGMSVLILEVAWFRRIAQLVGGTSVALASVLAAVIGGMALGAFWIGRRADRSKHPARLYGALELGVTCCALLSPWWLTNVVALAADAPIALRFLISTLALSPAAILMGGTLPALAAATGGRGLGWLYAFNTLGGVVGTLLAGFVLLPAFGLATTMRLAAIAAGIAALGAFRIRAASRPAMDTSKASSRATWLFAASGFLGMASEVAFTRQLVLVYGSSTYSFSTVLAVFLAGIAIGSAAGTWLSRRVEPLRALHATVLCTAALFAVASYCSVFLPRLYLEAFVRWGAAFGTGLGVKFALTALVILPGAIGSGVAFPLAVAAGGGSGRATGQLYGANTLASIIASTVAVFLLIPKMGPHGTIAFVAFFVAIFVGNSVRQILFATLVALPMIIPQPEIARERLAVGVYYAPHRYLRGTEIDEEAWNDGVDLPYTEFGRDATVSLFRWYGPMSLLVDGKAVASEQSVGDVQHLELLGHLPMAMKPNAERIAVVGLGLGTTYRAVASHQQGVVEVYEIEAAVANAIGTMGLRPRNLFIEDARQGLKRAEAFDVITSDPIHPWVRGGGDLYSREYFQLCKDRLRENGVVCHWLPLYQMGLEDVRSVVRTFVDVFQSEAYFAGTDLVLVGTATGTPPKPGRVATVFGEDLSQLRVAGHADLVAASEGAPILLDDDLRLEFSTPKHLASQELGSILNWVQALWKNPPRPYDSILAAQVAAAKGDGDGLGDALEQALKDAPQHEFARRYAGETYLQAAAQFDSDRFLKLAAQLLGSDDRLVGVEADLRARQGRADDAARLYRQLLESQPGNRYLKRRLARVAR